MKTDNFVWEIDNENDEHEREIRFEFEMDFGPDSEQEYYSGLDIEYDL